MRALFFVLAFPVRSRRVVRTTRKPRHRRGERRAAVRGELRHVPRADGDGVAGVDLGRGQFRRASPTKIRPHHQDRHPEHGDAAEQHLRGQRRQHRRVPRARWPRRHGAPRRQAMLAEARRFSKARAAAGAVIGSAETGPGPDPISPTWAGSGAPPNWSVRSWTRGRRCCRTIGRSASSHERARRSHRTAAQSRPLQRAAPRRQGAARSFQKSALREYAFVDTSPMPSYRDRLSAEEVADLVSYLVSLKVRVNP